jgi:hypothetical protein
LPPQHLPQNQYLDEAYIKNATQFNHPESTYVVVMDIKDALSLKVGLEVMMSLKGTFTSAKVACASIHGDTEEEQVIHFYKNLYQELLPTQPQVPVEQKRLVLIPTYQTYIEGELQSEKAWEETLKQMRRTAMGQGETDGSQPPKSNLPAQRDPFSPTLLVHIYPQGPDEYEKVVAFIKQIQQLEATTQYFVHHSSEHVMRQFCALEQKKIHYVVCDSHTFDEERAALVKDITYIDQSASVTVCNFTQFVTDIQNQVAQKR